MPANFLTRNPHRKTPFGTFLKGIHYLKWILEKYM
jgi:hypothetical protein